MTLHKSSFNVCSFYPPSKMPVKHNTNSMIVPLHCVDGTVGGLTSIYKFKPLRLNHILFMYCLFQYIMQFYNEHHFPN